MARTPITVAHGDGIGPEIMAATLQILDAAGAELEIETIEIGEKVYARGNTAGIEPGAWESLRRTRIFLEAPVIMPPGGGYSSLNVTARKTLGLYANVRPCVSYHPFLESSHPQMDVVIIRENEEDLYTGIEYRLSAIETEALKVTSRAGCEKIARYAFEYARQYRRGKVACFTKDKILKITDGLFHKVFDEVAAGFPDIQSEHWDVDSGAARLADAPETFDVIVMPNLYGDILSQIAAQIAGSVGLAGSANIGDLCAMFEAVQDAAPRRANQNLANPSGLVLASVLMLVHINQPQTAERVHNAWLRTIEDGIHTYDIFSSDISTQKVGTKEFACAVIARLGQRPNQLTPASYAPLRAQAPLRAPVRREPKKDLVGIDVYVDWPDRGVAELGQSLQELNGDDLRLRMISNRGVKVWPSGIAETSCTDVFRCRFQGTGPLRPVQILALLQRMAGAGMEVVKTEYLRNFDGEPGFSLTQGE